ncbi:MAG: thioesterase family protein [Solirubrobacterales bacterium]|nr:thioesterase family protein [Solirubrobacterales bacterium]
MSGVTIFGRDGDAFVPTAHAVGPWDPAQLHGGAPSALLARAVQDLAPELQLARLSVEFLGPVPLAPLELTARIVKPGKRFALAEAQLTAAGRPVLLARAVLLRRSAPPLALPEGAVWPDGLPCEGPREGQAKPSFGGSDPDAEGFHITGMDIRYAGGTGFGGERSLAWFQLAGPLVEGEETSPAGRAVAAADFGNGISHVLDFRTHLFVNTDLTVTLLRDPVGPWVLLDARTRIDPAGIGWASSVLHDQRGPVGFAQQTLFVQGR